MAIHCSASESGLSMACTSSGNTNSFVGTPVKYVEDEHAEKGKKDKREGFTLRNKGLPSGNANSLDTPGDDQGVTKYGATGKSGKKGKEGKEKRMKKIEYRSARKKKKIFV